MNHSKTKFHFIGTFTISVFFGCWIVALLFNLYDKTADKNTPTDVKVDYLLENAKRVELDPITGRPARFFQVKTLEHYPALQQTELMTPRVIIYKSNLSWHIEAKRGTAQEAQEKKIILQEEVVIQKQEANVSPTTLKTDFLTYLPTDEKMETERPVTILQNKHRIEALGMKAFLKTRQVDLLSHVRVYYEPSS